MSAKREQVDRAAQSYMKPGERTKCLRGRAANCRREQLPTQSLLIIAPDKSGF
jgi:hypothetical protein